MLRHQRALRLRQFSVLTIIVTFISLVTLQKRRMSIGGKKLSDAMPILRLKLFPVWLIASHGGNLMRDFCLELAAEALFGKGEV